MKNRLRRLPLGLAAVLALSLALNWVGSGWGLPNERSWSNDDQTPKIPIYAGGKFPLTTYLAEGVRRLIATEADWPRLPAGWLARQGWLAV